MRALRIALLISALGATSAQAGMFDDEEARRLIKDMSIKTERASTSRASRNSIWPTSCSASRRKSPVCAARSKP